jgi:membrane protease YdiL (CAAX protease family)
MDEPKPSLLYAGVVLFTGAVTLAGLALPLGLAARGKMTLPLWPTPGTWDSAVAVLAGVFLFARVEMLAAIVAEGRRWGPAAATFAGAAALHLSSVVATLGVLLPALKRRMAVAPAVVLAALAFAGYHLAQFNVFPAGRDAATLFTVFAFGLGYGLYYVWSRSLLLTALLQHLVAGVTLAYRADYRFAGLNLAFVYSAATVVLFLAFAAARKRVYAAERFPYF